MSTKTTFKRLALVTVAALGLGVLSVAPSSAVPQADSLTLSAATATGTVGTAVTVNATVAFLQETSADSMTLTLSYDQAPAGISIGEVGFSNIATVATDLGTPTVDTFTSGSPLSRVAKVSAATAASVNKTITISLTPTKAGTYVIRVTPTITGSTTVPASTFKTWTVTVAAKTLGWSTSFIGAYSNGTSDTATADAVLTPASTASTTPRARLDVGQGYGTTAGTDTSTAADAAAVVVTIDKGLIGKSTDYSLAAKTVTEAAATDPDADFYVFSNGDVGKATITITVGTNAAVTKTVTFIGAATTLKATAVLTNKTWTGIGASKVTTHNITAVDAADGASTRPTGLTVKSSDTSVATVAIASNETVTVTGVKAGTAVITVTDPATTAALPAITYTVTVKANKSTAPTITFDKTAYAAGELVTMTVNADMADSATANLFTAALVGSAAVTTTEATAFNGATHAIVGGKVTYKFYAPTVSGTWTVTGTTGADVDLTTAATVTGSFDIINAAADAATAAAELAEAAAQDATDAALDATEAATLAGALAQEAIDAVAALSTQVATLIAALKQQITALTKLVRSKLK
jgi:hypothetical protein